MKICWDNLEKLVYRKNKGYWVDKFRNQFFYKNSCKNCEEDFLSHKNSKSDFCSYVCSQSGKFHNFYGKKRPNHSKKMSGKNNPSYNKRFIGKDNPNWKGGITPIHLSIRMSAIYKEWRIKIFKKDNYKCVRCGYKGKYIQAHHIYSFSKYPDKRFDVTNGLTLCKNCHRKEKTNE